MNKLGQIDNKQLLEELQNRIQANQITSEQLARILKEKVNRIVKSQEEQAKQAVQDYEEWANDPAEWETDEREKWNG